MPFSDEDWQSIYKAIDRMQRPSELVRGIVKKRDPKNLLIWIEEFGDEPIPVASFDYEVTYYFESPNGTTVPAVGSASPFITKKKITDFQRKEVKTLCPNIGDFVAVLREQGNRRLPICVGVIRSTNY
jgi:hypothetical protein